MKIGGIETNENVLIIAEIGNNHEGSYALAEDLVFLAAEANADAVKFQTIIPERLVSIQQADRIRQLRKFQLTYDQFSRLATVAKKQNLLFLSTPFDIESARILADIVAAYKISSGDNNFYPLLEVVAKTGLPVIMSTGLMSIEEIKDSNHFVKDIWRENNIDQKLALLHCVSSYPTLKEQANLSAIAELREISEDVGYSDHTLGIEAAVLSIALGARIIEKHFTLDNHYSNFRDHQLSANPAEFRRMVEKIRNAEELISSKRSSDKVLSRQEIESMRRSIVAKVDLKPGHVLCVDDIDWVRPGGGLSPGQEGQIVGCVLRSFVKTGEQIDLQSVE